MRTVAHRPEHIIAAAWASRYVRERGVEVAHVSANGVRFEDPEPAAATLRATWAAEPRQAHILTKVYKPLIWLHDRVMSWWRRGREEPLALPAARTPWLPENIRDSVALEVVTTDGRKAHVDVPTIRRAETMSLIGMSSAVTAGAAVTFIPGCGNIWLVPGALAAGVRALWSYGHGDVEAGHAAMRTGAKLVVFMGADFIPIFANATFATTLAKTRSAFERYRAGEDLLDTRQAEQELEALTAPRQVLLTHALETGFGDRQCVPDRRVPVVVAGRDVVRS